MMTGSSGTFVISWTQTETDGTAVASVNGMNVGAAWRWTGEAVRVDGPGTLLRLTGPEGEANLRLRAARMVRQLLGAAVTHRDVESVRLDDDAPDDAGEGFIVTDGRKSFTATVIETPESAVPLLMFMGAVPPVDTDLWVVRKMVRQTRSEDGNEPAGGVICFTPGSLIRTVNGLRPIETLAPGDSVLTRDDGPQEILWIGQRRMSGARLYAMPWLRPVRIRAGALGIDRPDGDLLVSPRHRMLLRGRSAQALFGTSEVLVAAADLVNDRSVAVDRALREVTYMHLFFERHEVIWANGMETESFHPADTALDTVEVGQRNSLLAMNPDLAHDPHSYGEFARRTLSAPEAAILRHEGGLKAA